MMPIPFSRSCREVTTILIAREDRALGWRERIALRMHLAICHACPQFQRQILTLRGAMKQWRNYQE
jgi:Putative zinc-finger